MTLVGRGPVSQSDNGYFVPTFKDADGNTYALVASGFDTPLVLMGNVLQVLPADESIDVYERYGEIYVNLPDNVNNSPNALLFAKACGLEVSLAGLVLQGDSAQSVLNGNSPYCAGGAFVLDDSEGLQCCAYCSEGWGSQEPGYVGCSFEPVNEYTPDVMIECFDTSYLHNDNLSYRQQAHNACIFMLAGVPASVFERGE